VPKVSARLQLCSKFTNVVYHGGSGGLRREAAAGLQPMFSFSGEKSEELFFFEKCPFLEKNAQFIEKKASTFSWA